MSMTLAMDTKICTRYNVPAIARRLEVHTNSVWGWLRNKKKPKHPAIAKDYAAALKDPTMRSDRPRKNKVV